MAPRRGGGGGGGYSSFSCPDAYSTPYRQAALAYYVLFTVLFIGIFVSVFFVRRRSGVGKKVIGVPFVIAVFLEVVSRIMSLVSDVMYECSDLNVVDYFNVIVASRVMSSLAEWALLLVFVYVLNSMLLKQLGTSSSSGTKTVLRIVVGVMLAVIVANMALDCHVTVSDSYLGTEVALEATISQGLELACDILWMISVIIAAAVSLSNISALRSRRLPGGDLKGWATALYVALFIQATLGIVFSSYYFWPIILGNNLFLALSFISGLALVLVFIILLCIGKHNSWNQTVEKPEQLYAPVMQQHATYGHGNGQQDYYQQTPELVHAR